MNNDMKRANGATVGHDQNSITTEKPSFTIMNDVELNEKLTHFNRERIPERVVHAKGAGAYGTFTLTRDMSDYTCADLFCGVGKQTKVFVRFSTVGGERGSADTARDPRGFAVKFYTAEGNYDIVGNNTPVFFIRDAIKFPDFIHTQKRNPVTNLPDPNAFWDFLSLTPESMNQVLRLMSDNGTPNGFRFMNGFGNHTFMWYKPDGTYYWVKYHFISAQGIKNLTAKEATLLAGENPNYATQDLYTSIQNGNYPSWDVCVQILTPEQAANYRYNIFEVTKIIYEEDYPLIKIGRFTLNSIPENFFNESEQAAFCPGNFVTGIAASPDKMLNARAVMYSDAQRYRIGVNFNQLKVNAPIVTPANYERDGDMSSLPLRDSFPNYYPNSFGGPAPVKETLSPPIPVEAGTVTVHDMPVLPIDYEQPRRYYDELSAKDKNNLIENICSSLKNALLNIQYRQCAVFFLTSANLGTRVATQLGLHINKVIQLSCLTDEQRFRATTVTK
jgi:Catalase